VTNDINCFSFSHTRSYDVAPGNHTFYAVVENFFEIYGNGFASVYGSLTVQFYPDPEGSKLATQSITTPFGVNVEGPPVTVGTMNVNAPVAGKVAVNFVGTCLGTFGDKIRLAASNVPNWLPEDGNIEFKAYSSDINRTSFSHTRVYDVAPGDHTFYAVMQNVEEFDGSGLAVVYATMSTKFFPEGTIAVAEPEVFHNIQVSPNPASNLVRVEFPDLSNETFSLSLSDANGRIHRTFEKASSEFIEQMSWDVSTLPVGVYFLKMQHNSGTSVRQIVRL
ncbi:MAG: T9SS type A sorting domain-containing protein, partial [Saprospiraceae bacterium]|nr:T9SS type A sorting domain-containing protein [Saprospiraceae bacterium]